MNDEMKVRMAESVRGFRLPRYDHIPDIGLYLDQTTKYINGFLAPLGCLELTSSMVSNYVKKGLVPNPVKKQYYAPQIAHLFFVSFAKNLVSIEDVGLLLELQRGSYHLPVAYDYFCDEMENIISYMFGLKESIDDLGVTQSDEKNLLRSLVYSVANVVYLNACCAQLRESRKPPF